MALVIPAIFTAVDRISAVTSRMSASVRGFAGSADSSFSRLERGFRATGKTADGLFNKLTGGNSGLAVAAGFGIATYAVKSFIDEASKMEDTVAAFTPLLGGAEKAQKLVGMLNETAATTPFEFEHIAKAAQTLLPAMNGDLNKTISTFRMLGDTAGGKSEKLESITRGYTKALLNQKVTMESLNMIADAGVPIVTELSKTLGIAGKEDQVFKMISKGKVSVKDLEKTFQMMTSQGGIFFKGMETSSKTFSGQMSTLSDELKMTAATIGMEMLPVLKEFIPEVSSIAASVRAWATENKDLIRTKVRSFMDSVRNGLKFLVNNFDTIVTLVKIYIGTLITLRTVSFAAMVATNAMRAANIAYNIVLGITNAIMGRSVVYSSAQTVAMTTQMIATKAITAAQWLWNAAMMANPIGLIILAVIALIAIIVVAVKHWNEWGAALMIFLGPLGVIVSLVQAFRRNWDMINQAFTKGGFIEGIKAIGVTLLDALLMPLQQILEIVAKFTGADWATSAAEGIKKFRTDMGATLTNDTNTTIEAVNPAQARQDQLTKSIEERTTNATLTIAAPSNMNTSIQKDENFPIKLGTTRG